MSERQPLTVDRMVWLVTATAATVFWLVSTSFRPWNLFARAGFSADFYDEQARVFLRGGLAVDPAVPGPEGFLIDGATYLYYGPFLAMARLPFALFGDLFVGRLVRLSMLIALVVLCRWSARLARAGRDMICSVDAEQRDGRWAIPMFVAAVAFSPALFAAGWITVYNETELWALTLAVITIALTVEWAAGQFTDRRLVLLASLAALATTLTRAPIGFGVAFTIGVCGIVLLVRRRAFSRSAGLAVAGGLLPLGAHAAVNYAKFGSLLSVPGDRQLLSLQSPVRAAFFETTGGSFFSPQFLPTTVVQYLRPDAIGFERLVPFVRFGPLAQNRGSIDVETVTPASSLPSTALLLLILAVVGAVWIARERSLTWGLVVAATSLGALPTFMIGFVANRYLIDMLPPLIAAGAVGIWPIADRATGRRPLRFGLCVLAVFGMWVNAGLAIWTLELKSPGFTELRYDIDRSVFGDDSPNVSVIAPGDVSERDGAVGVTADCSAIYVAEQGRWVALERTAGLRVVAGVIDTSVPSVLAATATWSLMYESGEVRFARTDGQPGFVQEVPPATTVDYEVIADPIVDSYFARVGGVEFFLPADVVRTGGIQIAPDGIDRQALSTPLCVEVAGGTTEARAIR